MLALHITGKRNLSLEGCRWAQKKASSLCSASSSFCGHPFWECQRKMIAEGCYARLLSFEGSHSGQVRFPLLGVKNVSQAHVESLLYPAEKSILGYFPLQMMLSVCWVWASTAPWPRVLLQWAARIIGVPKVFPLVWAENRIVEDLFSFFLCRGKHENSLLWSGRTESARV